jgi:hypothetical protein
VYSAVSCSVRGEREGSIVLSNTTTEFVGVCRVSHKEVFEWVRRVWERIEQHVSMVTAQCEHQARLDDPLNEPMVCMAIRTKDAHLPKERGSICTAADREEIR